MVHRVRWSLVFRLLAAALISGILGAVPALAEVPQIQAGVPTGWGSNGIGALGQQASGGSSPVIVGPENPSTQVSLGCSHALYLHPDGTVWASGWNNFGQLGDGNSTTTSEAVQVAGLRNVTAIAAGCYHGMALKSDGTVWLWGQNQNVPTSSPPDGKCPGLGSEVDCFLHPTQWLGLEHITQIAAGVLDEIALAADGTVYTGGQIGKAHLTLPGSVTDVAMQSYKAEAITDAGLVYTWGDYETPNPTLVSGISGFAVALGGGSLSGYAVTSDGKAWAWGDDRYGQLGDGKTSSQKSAIQVPGLPPIAAIAGGFYHAVARDQAGGVWGWGDNANGEVGPQQPQEVDALPSQVPGIGHALAISAGGYTTLVLIAPIPNVTAIEPGEGPEAGGTEVRILGEGFSASATVRFGLTRATSVTSISPGELRAIAPTGEGVVDVTVETDGGQSATSAADRYTYLTPGPPPTITKVSPKKGPAAGGTNLVATGHNLTGATHVSVGGAPATFTVNSDTSLSITTPPGTSGKTDIRITTANGVSPISAKGAFTYEKPTVLSVSPASGPRAGGNTVSVTGTGFALGTATQFTFGKYSAISVTCETTSSCLVTVPAAEKTGVVDVLAKVGKAKSKKVATDNYTFD